MKTTAPSEQLRVFEVWGDRIPDLRLAMSDPLSPTIKRHYVAVTQHTMHAVRTAGNILQYSDECALVEMSASQRILREWSEGTSVSAIASVAPQPIWWQLVEAEHVQGLRSEADLRGFAARLPHGFRAPIEIISCHAADGMPLSSQRDGQWRWLLGVAPGDSLADAAAETIERGIFTTALGASVLACVGAAATVVRLNSGGSVLLWHIGHNHSYVFTIGLRGVEAVTRCEAGFKSLLKAVQELLGLKSPVEAARHFFTNAPAVRAAGQRLAAAVAPQLRAAAGNAPAIPGTLSFACTGLTNQQAWLGQEIARALGLPFWAPDLKRYTEHLQLTLETEVETALPELLGTIHLAAAHARGSPAWHPVWGAIGQISTASKSEPQPRERADRAAPISSTPAIPASAVAPRADNPVAEPSPISPAGPTEPAQAAPVARPQFQVLPPPTTESRSGADSKPPNAEPSETERVLHSAPASTPTPPVVLAARTTPPVPLQPIHLPSLPPTQPETTAVAEQKPPPQQPTPAVAAGPIPPREPVVIVLRKRGYWPHLALALAVLGAVVSWRFYGEVEALRAAANQEETVATEEGNGTASQETTTVSQQVTRLEEQRDQAEKRANESARAAAAEVERIRREAEAARAADIAQARREAEEQTRRQLAPELEAARAATRPGILKIDTSPAGAEVQIGNAPPRPAPVSIEDLSPGTHLVKIALPGHVPVELTADIVGSKTTDLGVITLERATGTMAISSEPIGSEFSIRLFNTDESSEPLHRGRTPARFDDLPPGEYIVQFSRAGWSDRSERVTITRGETTRTATTFESGTVTITSTPAGATVTRDGLVLGTTPLTLKDVPAQETTYELRANGYESLKVSGKVVAGRELKLEGALPDLDRLASQSELRTPPRPYVTTPLDLGRIPRSTPAFITVTFIVLRDGSLRDVTVLEKVDRRIAQRSVEAIAKWKFYPGVSHGGYPVNVRVSIPIKMARD